MKFDAIILAAGRGKRMKPFSDIISKPMLPILNKPLVSLIAEQLLRLGAQNIVITVSKSNEKEIKNYFEKQLYKEKITFCIQDPPMGTADAIYKAALLTEEETIISMSGDNLFSENFTNTMLKEFFNSDEEISCVMALKKVTKEEITKLASVKVDEKGLIQSIVEKPELEDVESTLASLSAYVLSKKVIKFFGTVPLSPRGEYEAPDAFLAMLASSLKIKLQGSVTREPYLHISNPIDLWNFNIQYLGDKENEISTNAIIQDQVTLKKSIIGPNVTIGTNSTLEECLVLEGVKIPSNTNLKHAVIGRSEKGFETVIIPE